MSTSTIQVSCTSRPARIAFVVERPNEDELQEIFKINSALWGGIFNPVIILDGSEQKRVGIHSLHRRKSYEQELSDLLRDFDPDVLINFGQSQLPSFLKPFEHRTFSKEKLVWNPWGHGDVSYFLEVWPILEVLWRDVYRGNSSDPQPIRYLDHNEQSSLSTYLMARFGAYAKPDRSEGWLKRLFDAQSATYCEAFRSSFVAGRDIFPITLTSYQLSLRFPGLVHNYVFFLLDPRDCYSVVDYWNLRAAGLMVFPLPQDHYQDFAMGVKQFAEDATYPINPKVMNRPSVLKGNSVSDDVLNEVGNWIAGLGIKHLSCQGWVPKFGSRGYRVAPELDVKEVTAKHEESIGVLSNGYGRVKVPLPANCEFTRNAASQHWCVDLAFYKTGTENETYRLPWLRRECDEAVRYAVNQHFEISASRVSKNGIVAWQQGGDSDVSVFPLTTEKAITAYLRSCGLAYEKLSSPGLATQRAVQQLGGLFDCHVLQRCGVREVLDRLSQGGTLFADEVRAILWRNKRQDEENDFVQTILNTLFEKRILRVGLQFQCSHCERHDWYHISEFSEKFTCKWCFERQGVPRLDDLKWRYRSDGLFSLDGKMQGVLATILSLRFFQTYFRDDFRYLPSFNYSDGDQKGELDFIGFSSDILQPDVDVVIGEVKTSQALSDGDKDRMRAIAEKTGAFIAFCTLADDFAESDKDYFRSLVAGGHRPILITGGRLDLSYVEVMEYRGTHNAPVTQAEALFRGSVIEILGKEFASQHKIWI